MHLRSIQPFIPTADVTVRMFWWNNVQNKRYRCLTIQIQPREPLRFSVIALTTCVESYLARFEICEQYNGWCEEDKTAQLKLSLKGATTQILWDKGEVSLSFNYLVGFLSKCLAVTVRMKDSEWSWCLAKDGRMKELLHCMPTLYDWSHWFIRVSMSDSHAVNDVLSALDDKAFELRIYKKNLNNLDEAAAIATWSLRQGQGRRSN